MKTKVLETYLRKAIAPDGSTYDVPVTVEIEYDIPVVPAAYIPTLAEKLPEGALLVLDELNAPTAKVLVN
jgi:hypothetical protein